MSGLSRKNTAVNFCLHPLCSLARGPLVRSWRLYQAIAAGAFREGRHKSALFTRELREKRRQDYFLSPQMSRLRIQSRVILRRSFVGRNAICVGKRL